jgi:hypothetical protein
VHEDLDRLLEYTLRLAHQMLGEHGELYPFAAVIRTDGEIVTIMAPPSEESPSSQRVRAMLERRLREMVARGECTATALCYDASVGADGTGERCNAVGISLEHTGGEAVVVSEPYRRSSGRVVYRGLMTTPTTPAMFVSGATGSPPARKPWWRFW